ncbi:MAG: hypothetical protein DPW16_07025 [Chloroflexi bacterium]|nr:hypothetical protein [Chloroflexota bacterium]
MNEIKSPIGRTIKNYEILELIDSGGQASVYKALQRDSSGRSTGLYVAAKVFELYSSDPSKIEERFAYIYQEMTIQNNIDHHGIVRIRDTDHDNDFAYIFMEFIDGQNLMSWMREREVIRPVGETLQLILEIVYAVRSIHENGYSHCDLTLRNILVKSKDNKPKIIDFGLARQTSFHTHSRYGTPAFMAPEIFHMSDSNQSVDPSADIYSIGVIFFYLLSGKYYLSSIEQIERDKGFLARAGKSELFRLYAEYKHSESPSSIDRKDIPASILIGLNSLLHKMLSVEPRDRPSINAVIEALQSIAHEYNLVEPSTDLIRKRRDTTVLEQTISFILLVDGSMPSSNLDRIGPYLDSILVDIPTSYRDFPDIKFNYAAVFYGEYSKLPAHTYVQIPYEVEIQPFTNDEGFNQFLQVFSDKLGQFTGSFRYQDSCNAMELGLKEVFNLIQSRNSKDKKEGLTILLVLGTAPPHPSGPERERFELLDWTNDEFGDETEIVLDWHHYRDLIWDSGCLVFAYWIEPDKKLEYIPDPTKIYARYVWEHLDSSHHFWSIWNNVSGERCLDHWNTSLTTLINQILNRR